MVTALTQVSGSSRPKITLRKSGSLLEISLGGNPPPQDIKDFAGVELQFQKKVFNYGADRMAYSMDGTPNKISVFPQQLYRYDEFGRMVCGYGFVRRVTNALTELGYPYELIDTSPKKNPDVYVPVWDSLKSRFQYRARQEECMKAIVASDQGLIHAATGFGKMVLIGMMCCLYPKAKFDIVYRGQDLAKKAQANLLKYIPNVGLVTSGHRTFGRVTVYTVLSMKHCPYNADFLIADEAHELLADNYVKCLAAAQHCRPYAFSASPDGRLDGADIRMEGMFGPSIFTLSYDDAKNLGLVVPIRVEWSDVRLSYNPCAGLSDTEKDRHGIWNNVERNNIIAAGTRDFGPDEQVQILVRTVEHAVRLKALLPDFTLIYGDMPTDQRAQFIRAGFLTPEEPFLPPAKRDFLRGEFEAGRLKKVISTSVWATGVDPVNLAALFRADAGSSKIFDIQGTGRVSRISDGKKIGIVRDFRDQFDSGYARKAVTRGRHYKELGWDQVDVPASPLLDGEMHEDPGA